jgi:hypothetical protein
MAGLPPDGEWLIQQIDGIVILFNRYTEEEITRFNPWVMSAHDDYLGEGQHTS